jgi:hypothetical protein
MHANVGDLEGMQETTEDFLLCQIKVKILHANLASKGQSKILPKLFKTLKSNSKIVIESRHLL